MVWLLLPLGPQPDSNIDFAGVVSCRRLIFDNGICGRQHSDHPFPQHQEWGKTSPQSTGLGYSYTSKINLPYTAAPGL